MKQFFLWIIISTFIFSLHAQDSHEFISADAKVLTIPEAKSLSAASIAKYITSDFKTDKEKIRAAYIWVANNIQYDKDSMYAINWSRDIESIAASTLRRRKGVCENFATLFSVILSKAGILSYIIHGYTKLTGNVDWSGHSWAAVFIDDDWLFCDPTWDAGAGSNTNYFLIKPGEFIETHMPFDPLWQLLPQTLSNREFYKNSLFNKKDKPFFNYKDSIKLFLKMDSLQQFTATAGRLKEAGLDNEMLQTWYAYIKMKAAIVNEEKNTDLYNAAVADYNKATTVYNDFVKYRNNFFKPAKPDDEIKALLDPLDAILSSAYIEIAALRFDEQNNQYDPSALMGNLQALQKKIKLQKDFFKRFLSTDIPEREKLFYQ